jgi:hypothetical protein
VARWVLECAQCEVEFTHSQVPESGDLILDPFTLTVAKPEFPAGGVTTVCPSCKEAAVYQRHQLLYRVQ